MEECIYYNTSDIADCLNCSLKTARDIMRRPDFPLIMVGKNFKVLKEAFIEWSMHRRT